MAGHGGKRPGAGRPKKVRTATAPPAEGQVFDSAEEYLAAVVAGVIVPDAVRVAAAKCLIGYQTKKRRAPQKSLTPTQMAIQEVRIIENSIAAEFEAKAKEIRARHAGRKKNGNS
jgi:hypothetical protein